MVLSARPLSKTSGRRSTGAGASSSSSSPNHQPRHFTCTTTTMAQGSSGKLGKAQKSKGSQKRQAVRNKKTISKGRKRYSSTKQNANTSHRMEEERTTKSINHRNETLVAAKAVSSGTRFFLSDMKQRGTQEMKKQIKERNKKQSKQTASKLSNRLEQSLVKVKQA